MARNLHTTCQRYFRGEGCTACPLANADCDQQGFVPQGQNPPPLVNPAKPRRGVVNAGQGMGSDSNNATASEAAS